MNLRGRELTGELTQENLESLIEQRLTGARTILPGPVRDEDLADVFVDLAAESEQWRAALATPAATLLTRWAANFRTSSGPSVAAVGELCYLVARIGSTGSLDPLRKLAGDPRATGMVAPGEDLQLRALRALVGLLGATPRLRATGDRDLLMAALAEPRLAVTAAAGLIGLWPEEREVFLRTLPDVLEWGELLDVAIRTAFPRP